MKRNNYLTSDKLLNEINAPKRHYQVGWEHDYSTCPITGVREVYPVMAENLDYPEYPRTLGLCIPPQTMQYRKLREIAKC